MERFDKLIISKVVVQIDQSHPKMSLNQPTTASVSFTIETLIPLSVFNANFLFLL